MKLKSCIMNKQEIAKQLDEIGFMIEFEEHEEKEFESAKRMLDCLIENPKLKLNQKQQMYLFSAYFENNNDLINSLIDIYSNDKLTEKQKNDISKETLNYFQNQENNFFRFSY